MLGANIKLSWFFLFALWTLNPSRVEYANRVITLFFIILRPFYPFSFLSLNGWPAEYSILSWSFILWLENDTGYGTPYMIPWIGPDIGSILTDNWS